MRRRASSPTVCGWIAQRAALTPERVAVDFLDQTLTYRELHAQSERQAAALEALGLQPGDRVATITRNSPEQLALLFACAAAGAVLVPLNRRLSAPELAYQLDDCGAKLLLSGPGDGEVAGAAWRAASSRPELAEMSELLTDRYPRLPSYQPSAADPLLIVYTSGTTGRPKGAVLSHANCFWTNLSLDLTAELTAEDVVLQVLPQHHVGGWNVQPLLAIWHGARLVLEPGFEPERTLDLIARKRVTTMMGVPTNYLFLAQQEGFAGADLSSLRLLIAGGAPMPRDLLERWLDRGVTILQGYGLTEAAPNVLCVPPEYAKAKAGSAGRPYLYVEVGLAGSRSGRLIAGAGVGEILVRGPNVFSGYFGNPAASAAALRSGWLHTGDLAERDSEGFYWLRGRISEMYISGGENVYPAEVEAAISAHPAVGEAVVVGVPDRRWGESGVAFVVPQAGAHPAPGEILAFVAQRLAHFKVPRELVLLSELPRASEGGKVLRGRLRQQWLDRTSGV